jgi:hypothetical protein
VETKRDRRKEGKEGAIDKVRRKKERKKEKTLKQNVTEGTKKKEAIDKGRRNN